METVDVRWASSKYKDLIYTPSRYKVFYGGRGGAKSHSFAEALVLMSIQKKIRVLCTREFQNSIADSVHRLLEDKIKKFGLNDMFKITKKGIQSYI